MKAGTKKAALKRLAGTKKRNLRKALRGRRVRIAGRSMSAKGYFRRFGRPERLRGMNGERAAREV